MPELAETIYAPEMQGGEWIQGGPVSMHDLRGKSVALIDFWDYTCINCIRTLPYVVEWDRRYADKGLVTIGVHAPEFDFARDHAKVGAALGEFGLRYPIVLDNGYTIWRAYSNRFWPAKYLVDANGRIRYFHFGEGSYGESEAAIQKLLRELNPAVELPPPMEPVRDSDRPGAVCYRVTPELYLGHARGQFGNPEGATRDRACTYLDPGHHAEGVVYLAGNWTVLAECSRAEAPDASIALRYTAKDVNLVLVPSDSGALHAELILADGQQAGSDVTRDDAGKLIVDIKRARMYNLVANDTVMSGSLQLKAQRSGLSAYAFTFVSCTAN
jgi:thiol-disulfide isomerase/thioredoxin